MDFKGLLNQVVSSGSSLISDSKHKLEGGLKTPSSGSEGGSIFSGFGKGALTGGALSLLLDAKKGCTMAGKAAEAGGAAALGALALKTYKGWANQPEDNQQDSSDMELQQENEERQNQVILMAMIAAAKADGHVDDAERERIYKAFESMGTSQELNQFVQQELKKPLDPAEVANKVLSPEEASEVYLASLLVVDEHNAMEKNYLEELGRQLKLEPKLIEKLEAQAHVQAA